LKQKRGGDSRLKAEIGRQRKPSQEGGFSFLAAFMPRPAFSKDMAAQSGVPALGRTNEGPRWNVEKTATEKKNGCIF